MDNFAKGAAKRSVKDVEEVGGSILCIWRCGLGQGHHWATGSLYIKHAASALHGACKQDVIRT